jgi:hypothetical protein
MSIGKTLKKFTFVTVVGLGIVTYCTLLALYHDHSYFDYLNAYQHQKQLDLKEESPLELSIEAEFCVNLLPPVGITDPNSIKKIEHTFTRFAQHLSYIRQCNADLVKAIEGYDILVLSEDMKRFTNFEARCTTSKRLLEFNLGAMNVLETVAHEPNHAYVEKRDKEKIKAIAKKYGYTFGINLKNMNKWEEYEEKDNEPQGIFQLPYQSITNQDGTPREFSSITRAFIYGNKQFKLDSRNAYDCLREIFDYYAIVGRLNPVEYEHALRLMSPEAILDEKTDPKELAREWRLPWGVIAEFNGIRDANQAPKPIRLVMPLSDEVTQGYEKENGRHYISKSIPYMAGIHYEGAKNSKDGSIEYLEKVIKFSLR